MIERITLRNFRSFEEATLAFPRDPLPLVLTGAAGSGKSNAVDAFRCLRGLVGGAPGLRGAPADLVRRGGGACSIDVSGDGFAVSLRPATGVAPVLAGEAVTALRGITVLDLVPERMRGWCSAEGSLGDGLHEHGSNLARVLHDMRARWEEVLEVARDFCGCDLRRLDVEESGGELRLVVVECFGGVPERTPAPLVSDGVLRAVALAAAAVSAPCDGTLAVEGVEAGLPPRALRRVVGRLAEIADANRLRVMLVTQSTVLLDALPQELVPHAVLCHRDPGTGASVLSRVADMPEGDLVLIGGALGGQYLRGFLERHAMPPAEGGPESVGEELARYGLAEDQEP